MATPNWGPSRNPAVSDVDRRAKRYLEEVLPDGLRVVYGAVEVSKPSWRKKPGRAYLHPDMIVPEAGVVVEVDPKRTHQGRERGDAERNALFEEAGWKVVRLRTGWPDISAAIGPHDVVTPRGVTKATMALVADQIMKLRQQESPPIRFLGKA